MNFFRRFFRHKYLDNIAKDYSVCRMASPVKTEICDVPDHWIDPITGEIVEENWLENDKHFLERIKM